MHVCVNESVWEGGGLILGKKPPAETKKTIIQTSECCEEVRGICNVGTLLLECLGLVL